MSIKLTVQIQPHLTFNLINYKSYNIECIFILINVCAVPIKQI